ncbi:MAG: Fic family protein, partial [Planctomycetota bacterium]
MDASKFTPDKTGELVRIEHPEKDWAFVPDSLPPNWKFPIDLWPLLSEARENLARLDGIGRTLPNVELLLRPLQGREAIRSSSLEGTYASPQDLLLFELEPRQPKSEDDPANAWLEVSNHSRALRQGIELLKELPLCLRFIRELNRTLLSNVRGKDRTPGEFRKCQVHIGSNRRFVPPPPSHLDACLDAFEKRLNEDDANYDPLVRCYFLHYQFEAIHPFVDGNGRVGRVLMSLMAYKWCNLTNPWLYMSPFFDRYKDEYLDNLFRISTQGAWKNWVEFCLRGTIQQAQDSIRRCDALRLLKNDFMRRAGDMSTRSHAIIEGLFTSPLLRIADLARACSTTYPTARTDVEGLV